MNGDVCGRALITECRLCVVADQAVTHLSHHDIVHSGVSKQIALNLELENVRVNERISALRN